MTLHARKLPLATAREQGWVNLNTGFIPGMAGVGVPVIDAQGRPVAALSVGTLAERLGLERLPSVVRILKTEATNLAAGLNPFDVSLRYPCEASAGLLCPRHHAPPTQMLVFVGGLNGWSCRSACRSSSMQLGSV